MKIYQIHEYTGEYVEDYQDRIVGSYLRKEKAFAKLEELERNEAERRIKNGYCSSCPINSSDADVDTFDVVIKKCSMHCPHAEIVKDEFFGYDCKNDGDYWGDAEYDIEEVEVEE